MFRWLMRALGKPRPLAPPDFVPNADPDATDEIDKRRHNAANDASSGDAARPVAAVTELTTSLEKAAREQAASSSDYQHSMRVVREYASVAVMRVEDFVEAIEAYIRARCHGTEDTTSREIERSVHSHGIRKAGLRGSTAMLNFGGKRQRAEALQALSVAAAHAAHAWRAYRDGLDQARTAERTRSNTLAEEPSQGERLALSEDGAKPVMARHMTKPEPGRLPRLAGTAYAALPAVDDRRATGTDRALVPGGRGFWLRHTALAEPVPTQLFKPRPLLLERLKAINSSKLRLPIPPHAVNRAAEAGASKGTKFAYLVLDEMTSIPPGLEPHLPFIAKSVIAPFLVDMIPSTSFSASLANLLTSASWGRIREDVVERFGGLCQICGEGSGSIECHEMWEYHEPPAGEEFGVQSLVGLLSLCHACHEMFHPGLADLKGRGDEVWTRLREVNRWTDAETTEFESFAVTAFKHRSRFHWLLDLRLVANYGLIVSSSSATEIADGHLEGRKFGSVTGILGAPWKMARGSEHPGATLPHWLPDS